MAVISSTQTQIAEHIQKISDVKKKIEEQRALSLNYATVDVDAETLANEELKVQLADDMETLSHAEAEAKQVEYGNEELAAKISGLLISAERDRDQAKTDEEWIKEVRASGDFHCKSTCLTPRCSSFVRRSPR